MYSVKVQSDFCAAHNLRGYRGTCERLHGHNWRVEAKFVSEELDDQGMVIDFKKAKAALQKIVTVLDHRFLNEIPYFKKKNPSSEHIARYVYDKLKASVRKPGCALRSVAVWEKEHSSAVYSERP